MEFMINIDLKKLVPPITYHDRIMLIGSCFTEHIGNALSKLKYTTIQNPHGILFGPDAVTKNLNRYVDNTHYEESDLFNLNEVWNSWDHHSRFSGIDRLKALGTMNEAVQSAHHFLKKADWLIITLGSAFSYRLTEVADKANFQTGDGVANCHRAPSQWFNKQLLEISEIVSVLEQTVEKLLTFNPELKIIFTVSPVRHIRDGVVENNRSKARLIESVHQLVNVYEHAHYFPAYELVIDVLRDYRFYDIDLVHPNYAATDFVLEKFIANCVSDETQTMMGEVKKLVTARKHRSFQPETKAHQQFLASHFEKAKEMKRKFPFLDLGEELKYFSET